MFDTHKAIQETVLPTPEQSLLLQAIISDGPKAFNAWACWRSTSDIHKLDEGSHRLLPMLYQKSQEWSITRDESEYLREAYEHTLCRNTVFIHRTKKIIRVFNEKNITVVLLKGLALNLHYYKDFGLRMMADIDLLVEPSNIGIACEILSSIFSLQSLAPYSPNMQKGKHAITLSSDHGFEVDLHWNAWSDLSFYPTSSQEIFSNLQKTSLDGYDAFILNHSFQLLHTFKHGLRANTVSPIRWVIDALSIIRLMNPEDWAIFEEYTKAYKFEFVASKALGYLAQQHNATIPQSVFNTLSFSNNQKNQKSLYYLQGGKIPGSVQFFFILWESYNLHAPQPNIIARLINFNQYIKDFTGRTLIHCIARRISINLSTMIKSRYLAFIFRPARSGLQ